MAEGLLNKRLLFQELERFEFPNAEMREKINKIINGWQIALKDRDLNKTKEKEIQGQFLSKFFGEILGYTAQTSGQETYTMKQEPNTEVDATNPDGSLGFYGSENITRAVIELKDAKTPLDKKQATRTNKLTPVEQAFSYVNKYDQCDWIIVSNFNEIRLYHKSRGMGFYEKFEILELHNEKEFKRFYYCLCADNLIDKNRQSKLDILVKDTSKNEEEITKQFYKDFKAVRLKLFEHICAHNHSPLADAGSWKKLLLEKTQKLLDRMVFIFFCEDTGLLPPLIVRQVYKNGLTSRERNDQRIWGQFKNLFIDIDEGRHDIDPPINAYNGGLFATDEIIDNLNIKDDVWEDIVKISDYDFDSDLNVNILGHIFEQSLNDLEQLKNEIDGIEQDKTKSKRKKDGIFYTPEYITRYIVEQTVGKYLEENPDKLETIKILDPACGSGAFLNQAHTYLRQQHEIMLEEKLKNTPKDQLNVFEHINKAENDRSILLNNIFGVDLNEESVEITKLALWLKTAHKGYKLQDLSENIKCGNSLIDDPEIAGDKAFNWDDEFNGGFDVIIGNPPYVFARGNNFTQDEKQYYYNNYQLTDYQINTYLLFIEKAYKLLKQGGYLGFIVPNNWLTIDTFKNLREFILKNTNNLNIINLKDKIFEDANVDTCLLIFKKDNPDNVTLAELDNQVLEVKSQKSYEDILQLENSIINITLSEKDGQILNKINLNANKLIEFATVSTGLKAYQIDKGKPKQTEIDVKNRIYHSSQKINNTYAKYLEGKNVDRYLLTWAGEYLRYGDWLAEPRKSVYFDKERILVRQIPSQPPYCINAIFTNEYYLNDINSMVIFNFAINPLFVLSVLNCKLTSFWFINTFDKLQRGLFPQFKVKELSTFPIPQATPEQQESLANKAGEMIELNKQLHKMTADNINYIKAKFNIDKISQKLEKYYFLGGNQFLEELKKNKIKLTIKEEQELLKWFEETKSELTAINTKIQTLDNAIDQEVYKLYNLTEAEIAIVEGK